MHIKSILLDGFKSYGNRVEITGFDPEFNAITGLNGTGKSNILDSICFVLGITNLSNVRAGSLQELIYKHGQAGITKATVSITFDNRDRRQCPIGYENQDEITVTRQVVMGGKNKYMINGINVQNKRVSDLFCSVQLNVNNPHFLIMQGRITKVLNMKPAEILSMVEEAAGTRMYEAKKQAAQKTIEKKDAKLRDLNEIIREDIAPRLQKLQDERAQFQEYQKVVRELENLTRLYIAYTFVMAEEKLKDTEGKVTGVQDQVKSLKEEIKDNAKEIKEFDKQIAEITKKLNEECGDALRELETELQTVEKTEASKSAAHKAEREALTSQSARARLLERSLGDDEAALQAKQAALGQVSSTFEKLREASESSNVELTEAQQKFLAVSTGLEGASESLQDQLMAAKQKDSEAVTLISQTTMEIKHAENRLNALEKEFNRHSAQYTRDTQEIVRAQAQLDALQAELSAMSFSPAAHASLRARGRELEARMRTAGDECARLAPRLQRCNFSYSKPVQNFDSMRVSGTICRLIQVRDAKYSRALEITAGGRLYNVVVDNEETSKLLLQHGDMRNRTTIIPLNRISPHIMERKTLAKAQQIGGGPEKVQLALDLISFDSHLRRAMAWVFGNTLVCSDLDTAKRVAFHPAVRRRAVVLDGDVCDPGGTLTGGAAIQGDPVLIQLEQLKKFEEEHRTAKAQLAQCNAELESMEEDRNLYTATQQKFDIKTHELNIVKARLASTSHAQTHAEIESLRAQIAELKPALENAKLTQQQTAAQARELEDKVQDIKGHREREYKKAEEALKKAKKDAELHGTLWKQREQELETLKLEVLELQQAVTHSREQLREHRAAAARMRSALDHAQAEHAAATEAVKEMQDRIKRQKAEIASRNTEISHIVREKEQMLKRNGEIELQIKELEYTIKEMQTEATAHNTRLISLEDENPWISSERQYFGLAGGMFDFKEADVAGARLAQLKERKDKLARGLNARAHTLLGKEEEQYQDLMRKKQIVEADRAKLVQVMAELDEKKKKTLITACEQVNRDFGSIFSTLLPGAQAQLRPPDGRSVLDGLEIRVGFNATWKESLGELSGGQRSLVALSLVLAMLLFKPAPLYVLDEVDAALDLSHTQNIGQMLKEHFKHSQFIIVSLKDGMFNNANVLFRTRFVDGMSDVQRSDNSRR